MSNDSAVGEATAEELDEQALNDGADEGDLKEAAEQKAGEEEEEAVVATPTLASTLMCALLHFGWPLGRPALLSCERAFDSHNYFPFFVHCTLPRTGSPKIARSAAFSAFTCS